jgi:hypothetical protein
LQTIKQILPAGLSDEEPKLRTAVVRDLFASNRSFLQALAIASIAQWDWPEQAIGT